MFRRKIRERLMASFLMFLNLCCFTAAEAVPAQVLLIRHGEKPQEGIHLNTRGRERALALVPEFLDTPELNENGPPVAIYAQKQVTDNNSVRPIETVTPLANALGIEINTTYERDNYLAMVDEILTKPEYEGKTVLISWGHIVLGHIAFALGAKDAPREWPHAYDRVWIITYEKDNSVVFSNIPQRLLYGDSQR